jgi:hypothetical protein
LLSQKTERGMRNEKSYVPLPIARRHYGVRH